MSVRSKVVWNDEWIKRRPLMSDKWPNDYLGCNGCRRATCATHWYSLKTKKWMCRKCQPEVGGESIG
jgi:hypothetical protein